MVRTPFIVVALLAAALAAPPARAQGSAPETIAKLKAIVAAEHRPELDKARDRYRNPVETLAFFGIRDDMTVVEIWPGSGWYTRILGPFLKDRGKLYLAAYEPGLIARNVVHADAGLGMQRAVLRTQRQDRGGRPAPELDPLGV